MGGPVQAISLRFSAASIVAVMALTVAVAATSQAETVTKPKPIDPRIRLVFFPVAGLPATVSIKNSTKLDDDLVAVGDAINAANPLYNACVQNETARKNHSCEPSSADIIISTQFRVTNNDPSLLVSSVDLSDHRILGSVLRHPLKPDARATTDEDKIVTEVASALKFSDSEVRSLIGSPVVREGRLSTIAGYQPYLQLVPDMSSDDPSYVGMLQNLLAKRGIASVPSQFNAGTITGGNSGLDALCGLGQRYLVYSLAHRPEDRPLSFSSRIQTRASGHFYDCPTKTDLPFSQTGAHIDVPNTKLAFAGLIPLLTKLFVSKTNSWTNVTDAGVLVTNVVDVAPSTDTVKNHSAEITLQQLVDSFCDRLTNLPTPRPATTVQRTYVPPAVQPTSTPAPKKIQKSKSKSKDQTPGGEPGGSPPNPPPPPTASSQAAPASTQTASLPLDIGNFLADSPPPLKCSPNAFAKP